MPDRDHRAELAEILDAAGMLSPSDVLVYLRSVRTDYPHALELIHALNERAERAEQTIVLLRAQINDAVGLITEAGNHPALVNFGQSPSARSSPRSPPPPHPS